MIVSENLCMTKYRVHSRPMSNLNALVYFHQDDMAEHQKRDFDEGKIYFWARCHVVLMDPPVTFSNSYPPDFSLTGYSFVKQKLR